MSQGQWEGTLFHIQLCVTPWQKKRKANQIFISWYHIQTHKLSNNNIYSKYKL